MLLSVETYGCTCDTLPVFHVGDIIRKVRKEKGLSIPKLAMMAQVNKATLSSLERGESNYEKETLSRVARSLGMTAESLLRLVPDVDVTASPTPRAFEPKTTKPPKIETVELETVDGPREFAVVPLLADRIAAGRPLVVRIEDIESHVAFPPALIDQLGVTKPYCVRVGRNERSMFPTIAPDSIVLLDCSDAKRENPKNGRIYAVNVDEGSTLKRVVIAGGVITLHSDNLDKKEYPSLTIEGEDGSEVSNIIVGEAVWCGTSLL